MKLLFTLLMQLFSCSSAELEEVVGNKPSIQHSISQDLGFTLAGFPASVGYCGCFDSIAAPTVSTSLSINSLGHTPGNPPSQFKATVNSLSDCNMTGFSPSGECQCIGKIYYLKFNGNYQKEDFSNIQLTRLDGSFLQHEYLPNNDGIWTNKPFIANLTWDPLSPIPPLPSTTQLTSGGICIIGILTDIDQLNNALM